MARAPHPQESSAVLPSSPRSSRPVQSVPPVTARAQPPGRPQSRARSQQPTSTPWHPPKVDNGRSDPISFWMPSSALAAARGDAAMSAHLSQQLGGAEREPPAWLAHEIARHSRLPRPDDSAARAREGGAFLATSRRPSGAASARPVVLHFYSLACRDGVRRRRRERSISFKIRKAANEGV